MMSGLGQDMIESRFRRFRVVAPTDSRAMPRRLFGCTDCGLGQAEERSPQLINGVLIVGALVIAAGVFAAVVWR
ncbi:MAG: hypothetical protein JSV86_19900 [Gemmatimonadota bacterium]|nr:MAG: hypothetical protein JSV86_19900 [Gemmatimonadota bacterium]